VEAVRRLHHVAELPAGEREGGLVELRGHLAAGEEAEVASALGVGAQRDPARDVGEAVAAQDQAPGLERLGLGAHEDLRGAHLLGHLGGLAVARDPVADLRLGDADVGGDLLLEPGDGQVTLGRAAPALAVRAGLGEGGVELLRGHPLPPWRDGPVQLGRGRPDVPALGLGEHQLAVDQPLEDAPAHARQVLLESRRELPEAPGERADRGLELGGRDRPAVDLGRDVPGQPAPEERQQPENPKPAPAREHAAP
jgi:hypothetical protein